MAATRPTGDARTFRSRSDRLARASTSAAAAAVALVCACSTEEGESQLDAPSEVDATISDGDGPDATLLEDAEPDEDLDAEDGPDEATTEWWSWPDGSSGPPPELTACEGPPAWEACRVVAGPVDVTDEWAQWADVEWTGTVFLVSAMAPAPVPPGHGLTVVAPDGVVVSRQAWPESAQFPRVAMNPALGVALLTFGSGVHWLAADGTPLGDASWDLGEEAYRAAHPEPAPTPTGFLLLSADSMYPCCGSPPLWFSLLGPTPGPVTWETLSPDGPRLIASHAVGADGLARWLVSSTWYGESSEAYPVLSDGTPGSPTPIPSAGLAEVLGATIIHDALYVLRGDYPNEGRRYLQQPGSARPPLRVPGDCGGQLESVGDTLVFARNCAETDYRTELQAIDESTGAPYGPALVLGEARSSYARAARTPRGLGVVWHEPRYESIPGGEMVWTEIVFARIDCCTE